MDYAGAAKSTPPTNAALIKLLMDLLVAITSTNDPKIIITNTINAFLTILAQQ